MPNRAIVLCCGVRDLISHFSIHSCTLKENRYLRHFLLLDDGMKGFRLAVSSMKPGEKAIFSIPQRYAQGNSGGPAILEGKNIPLSQILRFDVELICFITDINKDQGILNKITKSRAAQRHTQPNHLDEVLGTLYTYSRLFYS